MSWRISKSLGCGVAGPPVPQKVPDEHCAKNPICALILGLCSPMKATAMTCEWLAPEVRVLGTISLFPWLISLYLPEMSGVF